MSQDRDRPIKLSVHESSDPSVISRDLEAEPSSNLNDLMMLVTMTKTLIFPLQALLIPSLTHKL